MNNLASIQVDTDKVVRTTADLDAVLADISFENSILNFDWKYCHRPYYELVPYQKNRSVLAGWLLWVEFVRPDIHTGKMGTGRGRDEIIRVGCSESGVVKTAWVLYRFIIEHEAAEGFHYKNIRIFNPHHTVHELSLPALILDAQNRHEDDEKNKRNLV